MAWMAGTVVYAGQPQQKVTVFLLDKGNVPSKTCIPAQALAGRMFAAIGISLEWAKGKPSGQSSQPPILIELATGEPKNFKPDVLAYALPYEGSHITVLVDRIENMRAASKVLAHVIVHEITHLLQGISQHSATGVMKARWTSGDFTDMRFRPLSFTPLDIELIYFGLAQRNAQLELPVR
jgi:hypothetical protein